MIIVSTEETMGRGEIREERKQLNRAYVIGRLLPFREFHILLNNFRYSVEVQKVNHKGQL
jgi:hypothetical protein